MLLYCPETGIHPLTLFCLLCMVVRGSEPQRKQQLWTKYIGIYRSPAEESQAALAGNTTNGFQTINAKGLCLGKYRWVCVIVCV